VKRTILLWCCVLAGALVSVALAQKPIANIDAKRHPHLAAAQQHIAEAYQAAAEAQKENKDELGGHAAKANELLVQADQELKLAAEFADHRK
jgi:F0F1-type ATP synthase membrane subunit b/b'